MKKNLFIFLLCCATGVAYGYNVCGVNVENTDYAYNYTSQTELGVGYWANGSGCTTEADVSNISELCTTIRVAGESFCSDNHWGNANLDESTARVGIHCWCRRTKMQNSGQLVDSIGQWVLIGITSACQTVCGEMCAQTISENANGMRNAIMVLPSF